MARSGGGRIFLTDGYRELEAKEQASKAKKSFNSYIAEKREAKSKELKKLRQQEAKRKKPNPNGSKTLVPKGSGKRRSN